MDPVANHPEKALRTSTDRRSFLRAMGLTGAAVASAPLLAACGGSPGSDTGPSSGSSSSDKTLTLMLASWVDQGFLSEVMQGSAANSIGVKLNLVTVDDGTYPAQAAAAQKSGNPPDLIFWTAQGLPVLKAAGIELAPVDGLVSAAERKDFYEQSFAANSLDGQLYGLGFRAACRGIVYRQDFAKAAGQTIPSAWTFDEFGSFATAMTQGDRAGFGFEAKTGDGRSSSNFLPLIWSTGADFVKGGPGKWEVGFTEEQMTAVMQFYYDSVQTWKSTPAAVGTWGYENTDGNFAKGTLASYSSGPFVYPNAKNYPDTLANLAVAPLPNGGTPVTFWEEQSLFLHTASKKQDLAGQFMKAMRSSETQALIAGRTGDAQLAVRTSANDKIDNAFIKSFADLLPTARVPEPIAVNPLMNNAVLPAIQSVTVADTSPKDAAAKLIADMKTQLAVINGS